MPSEPMPEDGERPMTPPPSYAQQGYPPQQYEQQSYQQQQGYGAPPQYQQQPYPQHQPGYAPQPQYQAPPQPGYPPQQPYAGAPQQQQVAQPGMVPPIWHHSSFILRQKVFAIANKYYILDGQNNQLGFCAQKLLRFKEDIRIFTDESKTRELLAVQQTQIVDAWATFRITDSTTGQLVGYLKRQWGRSFLRSEWHIHDGYDRPFARIIEDSAGMAILRRILTFLPAHYFIEANNVRIARLDQRFQIIGDTWYLDASADPSFQLDRRLLVTAALLMDIVEEALRRA